MYPRLNPIATLLALSFAPAAFAVDKLAALDPVLVTATRQEMRASELLADVSVIDREEIERTGQGTITELLARQPGIQTASNGGPGNSITCST